MSMRRIFEDADNETVYSTWNDIEDRSRSFVVAQINRPESRCIR